MDRQSPQYHKDKEQIERDYMKYQVVVVDPPWKFSDNLTMSKTKRGGASNYDCINTKSLISDIHVHNWIESDAILALWFPAAMMKDAIYVAESWGFKPKQIYTWVKSTKHGKIHFGMGHYFRNSTEYSLIGIKGSPRILSKSYRNIGFAQSISHSAKPECLQDSLEKMFEGPYIELFARRQRNNWTCVGLECTDGIKIDLRKWKP